MKVSEVLKISFYEIEMIMRWVQKFIEAIIIQIQKIFYTYTYCYAFWQIAFLKL